MAISADLTPMQATSDSIEVMGTRSSPEGSSSYSRTSLARAQYGARIPDAGSAFDVLRQQISGSLQGMAFSHSPRTLPPSDPYKPSHGAQAFLNEGVLALCVERSQGHRMKLFEETGRYDLVETAAATEKVVAEFVGRVESLIGDSASVILINKHTGERMESRCDAEVLQESGIGVGDEFRCAVVRSRWATSARLTRLLPKTLSKEQVREIRASFKDRWQF